MTYTETERAALRFRVDAAVLTIIDELFAELDAAEEGRAAVAAVAARSEELRREALAVCRALTAWGRSADVELSEVIAAAYAVLQAENERQAPPVRSWQEDG